MFLRFNNPYSVSVFKTQRSAAIFARLGVGHVYTPLKRHGSGVGGGGGEGQRYILYIKKGFADVGRFCIFLLF